MDRPSQTPSFVDSFRELPKSLQFVFLVAAGFMLFVSWDQMHWWRTRDDYMFGFLVPIFVAYVIFDRWPQIISLVTGRPIPVSTPPAQKEKVAVVKTESGSRGCAKLTETGSPSVAKGKRSVALAAVSIEATAVAVAKADLATGLSDKSPRACSVGNGNGYENRDESHSLELRETGRISPDAHLPGWLEKFLKLIAYVAVLGGLLLFTFGAFYRAGAGPSHPGSLFIALGFATILLPLIFLYTPRGGIIQPDGAGLIARLLGDRRLKVASLFIFVAFIWIISAPMVSFIENRLSLFLLNKVTVIVFFVFEMGGFALVRQGNILILPLGEVGIADACSGIRSLTACLFAGSFMGAVFLNRFWKKVALVIAAAILAFVTNIGRSIFLTGWAYAYGPDAISGFVHDATGYAVLGFTCIGLMALLPIFQFNLNMISADDIDDDQSWEGEKQKA